MISARVLYSFQCRVPTIKNKMRLLIERYRILLLVYMFLIANKLWLRKQQTKFQIDSWVIVQRIWWSIAIDNRKLFA